MDILTFNSAHTTLFTSIGLFFKDLIDYFICKHSEKIVAVTLAKVTASKT